MSKGKDIGTCKTCGGEIVELVNESLFGEGQCEPCEYDRYKLVNEAIEALDYLLEQTLDRELAAGNELDDREEDARDRALAVLNKANGTAS
jgi:hypothetical protein